MFVPLSVANADLVVFTGGTTVEIVGLGEDVDASFAGSINSLQDGATAHFDVSGDANALASGDSVLLGGFASGGENPLYDIEGSFSFTNHASESRNITLRISGIAVSQVEIGNGPGPHRIDAAVVYEDFSGFRGGAFYNEEFDSSENEVLDWPVEDTFVLTLASMATNSISIISVAETQGTTVAVPEPSMVPLAVLFGLTYLRRSEKKLGRITQLS